MNKAIYDYAPAKAGGRHRYLIETDPFSRLWLYVQVILCVALMVNLLADKHLVMALLSFAYACLPAFLLSEAD